MKRKIPHIVIIGCPGVGKTTVLKALLSLCDDILVIKRYTSRPKRRGEKNSPEYIFVSKEKFADLEKKEFFIPELVDRGVEEDGQFYCTGIPKVKYWPVPSESTQLIVLLPGRRIFRIKEDLPALTKFVYLTHPSKFVIMSRAAGRQHTQGAVYLNKLKKIKNYLNGQLGEQCDFVVNNDGTPDQTARKILNIAGQITLQS